MFGKNRNKKVGLCLMVVTACLILAGLWAVLATPETALANPPDGDGNHNHGGGGGKDKDGGGGTIAVTVTFRDDPNDPDDPDDPVDGIQSDGEPYIHKVDKVSTGIGTPGNFFMKLTKGSKPAIRTLFFDFSDCASLDEDECKPPFPEGFSVGPMNMFTSGINLREMGVDQTSTDLSVMMALDLISVDLGLWYLFFDPVEYEGSSNITVTRTGADTWVIETGETDVACLVEVKGGGVLEFRGLYHMPFMITVEEISD